MADGQQLEPLVLEFDVRDAGSAKLDSIQGKLDSTGKALKRSQDAALDNSRGMGYLYNSLTRLPGPIGLVAGGFGALGAAMARLPAVMGLVVAGGRAVIGTFGAMYRSLFGLRTLVVGFGAGWLASSFISAASEVEQYELRLRQLTGSVEEGNRIFADASRYASGVAHSYRDVIDSAVRLRTVVSETPEQTAALVRLAGDIAAATGMSMERTTEQLSRALSAGIGSADQWREKGISAMLGFQAGVSYTAEETARIITNKWLAMDSEIRGAATNLADTFAGQMSMLGDKWFQFRTRVMDAGVFEFLKDGLRGVNNVLDHWLEKSDEAFGAAVSGKVSAMRAGMDNLGGAMIKVTTFGVHGFNAMRDAVWGTWYGLLQVSKGINEVLLASGKLMDAYNKQVNQSSFDIMTDLRSMRNEALGWFGMAPIYDAAPSTRTPSGVEKLISSDVASLKTDLGLINAEIAKMDAGLAARGFKSFLEGGLGTVEQLKKDMRELGQLFNEGFNPPAATERTWIDWGREQLDRIRQLYLDRKAMNDLAANLAGASDTAGDMVSAEILRAEQRQRDIEGLLGQLRRDTDMKQRHELAKSPEGIRQIFESDTAAVQQQMYALGIYQDHEAEFLQWRGLAWNQAAQDIARAEELIRLEQQKTLEASDNVWAGLRDGLTLWVDQQGSLYQRSRDMIVSSIHATRDALVQFSLDVVNRTGSIMESFRNMALGIVQSLQRIVVEALITAAILAVLPGGAAAGTIGAALAGVIGGSTSGGPTPNAPTDPTPTLHNGGLVGGSAFRMPASNGPSHDEVSAVLQRGEYVVSRRGVDALDRLNAGDAGAISGRGNERQVDRAVIISEEDILTFAERSGRFRQAIVQITREDGGAR